jgi:hypothetical protein
MRILAAIVLATLLTGCLSRARRAPRSHAPTTRYELEIERDKARSERYLGIGGVVAGLLMVTAGIAFAMSAEDASQRPGGEDGDGLAALAGAVVFLGLGTTLTLGGAVMIGTKSVEIHRAERAIEALDHRDCMRWQLGRQVCR